MTIERLQKLRQVQHSLAYEFDWLELVPKDEPLVFKPAAQGAAFVVCPCWQVEDLIFLEDALYGLDDRTLACVG